MSFAISILMFTFTIEILVMYAAGEPALLSRSRRLKGLIGMPRHKKI